MDTYTPSAITHRFVTDDLNHSSPTCEYDGERAWLIRREDGEPRNFQWRTLADLRQHLQNERYNWREVPVIPPPAAPTIRWHNPHNLTTEQVGPGRRLLTVEELQSLDFNDVSLDLRFWRGSIDGWSGGNNRLSRAERDTFSLPANFPIPGASASPIRWHNTRNVTPEELNAADGWRLLTMEEFIALKAEGAQVYDDAEYRIDDRWNPSRRRGRNFGSGEDGTYRTKHPLPGTAAPPSATPPSAAEPGNVFDWLGAQRPASAATTQARSAADDRFKPEQFTRAWANAVSYFSSSKYHLDYSDDQVGRTLRPSSNTAAPFLAIYMIYVMGETPRCFGISDDTIRALNEVFTRLKDDLTTAWPRAAGTPVTAATPYTRLAQAVTRAA